MNIWQVPQQLSKRVCVQNAEKFEEQRKGGGLAQ